MATEYEQAHENYRKLVKAAAGGDKKAFEEKAKAMGAIREIERNSARAGTILSATYKGEKIETSKEQTESKKSLQEEYCRRFDDKVKVQISEDVPAVTLRQHHKQRLGV